MAGETSIPVSVSLGGGTLWVRPSGPCTMATSEALRSYLKQFTGPVFTDIYFDLSRADWVDSTFAGFLVSLVKGRSGEAVPAVHLVCPSSETVDALDRMHLMNLFDVCQAAPAVPENWLELPCGRASADNVVDMVIQSHQELIRADDRNAPVFGPIVDALLADWQRKHPPQSGN